MKSTDFFNTEKYPQIKFTASRYENINNDKSYSFFGDLTIKETTKAIKLSVEFKGIVKDTYRNTKAGITINGKTNRQDFGLTWSAVTEAGGVLVSDEVKINCEIQLIEQQ